MSCCLLVTLLLTTLGDSTRVPGRDRAIAQFHHTAWTAKDGAPSQIIALAQTKDGYLWIGTARGLFRFDGVRFERYADPAGVQLPSHNVGALLATANGGLWISTRYGLGFVKDGRLTVFTQPHDLPEGGVLSFAADLDGRVWAGTVAGLAVRSGSRWLEVGSDWNVGRGPVNSLMMDRQGTLWVGIKGKLWCLPRGSRRFEGCGIIRWAERLRVGADKILFDREGTLWAVGGAHGLVRVRYPERALLIERFGERDGLSGDLPWALLEDIEGAIWVGTNKGLDRFRHGNVVPVELPANIGEVTLLAGENGDVWVGSTTGTKAILSEFPEASIIILTTYDGDEDIHRALAAGARGYLLKDMLRTEVLNVVRSVRRGQRGIPPPVAARLAEHTPRVELTPRETEVLQLVATGLSNLEIAGHIGRTEGTVKVHIKNILQKLGVDDRTAAVTTALQRGFIRLD